METSFIIKSAVLCAWASFNTLLNGKNTPILQFINCGIGLYLLAKCFMDYGLLYSVIWLFVMWECLGIFRKIFLALGMRDFHRP